MSRRSQVFGLLLIPGLALPLVFSGQPAGPAAPAPPAAAKAPEAKAPAATPRPGSEVTGRVIEVTLYRGQALVTRAVPVAGPRGPLELVVAGLPEQVAPTSVFAEGTKGVEVRAVRFRSRAVGEEPREEVRKLDEQIEGIREKLQAAEKTREMLVKRAAYLDQLESGFIAPAVKTDLAKGVLNAEVVEKVSTFTFDQRKAIAAEQTSLEKEVKELNKSVALLEKKKAELTGGTAKAVREAVLFLEKLAEGNEQVRLSYLVQNCGWSPTYTFRAGKDRKEAAMECSALIHQVTGEDWSGVTLTLSTATPALAAAGPGLAPFPVVLRQDLRSPQPQGTNLAATLQSVRGKQSAALAQSKGAMSLRDNIGSSWGMNIAANEWQALELTSRKDDLSALRLEDSPTGEEPSLSYQLAGVVSLASRSDQQMVRILQTNFKATAYYVAIPVLTSFVYREAEMTNNGPQDLLAGPIAVYLDDRFVGRAEIPTVARGQTFVVGFGADPQLRARRELANRHEEVQGGNRELSFTYRLVLENYKDEEVPVRLFDRLPYSDRPGDIRVKLTEPKDPLSTDTLYVRTEKPKNLLRWDINVPARAAGDKVRIVEYSFTVDHDRNFAMSVPGLSLPGQPAPAESPAILERLHQEFEMQQRGRAAR